MSVDFSKVSLAELASTVSTAMEEASIDCVLVGGACVSIYSENKYQSYDLDYVTWEGYKKLGKVLESIGFEKDCRYFKHKECPFLIDFVAPPVAIGEAPITTFNKLGTHLGVIKLLTPTDCVKDRLASFYHWDDKQALEQALMVSRDQDIDLEDIREWSKGEKRMDLFAIFEKQYLSNPTG